MKIFISWSGEKSRLIAQQLKELLENCIQTLDVFFSDSDIEKGEKWHLRLMNELADTNFGVVCLTKENCESRWINYEAGALTKQLDSNLSVLYIDLNAQEVGFPLAAFQASRLVENDLFSLVSTINSKSNNKLSQEKLKIAFSKYYPDFTNNIKKIEINNKYKNSDKNVKLIEAMYDLVKRNSIILESFNQVLPSISDDLEDIMKDDYSKKYQYISSKMFDLIMELSLLNDSFFATINENRVLNVFLAKVKEIMKSDSLFKRRVKPRINIIEEKLRITEDNGKVKIKSWKF